MNVIAETNSIYIRIVLNVRLSIVNTINR